MSVLSERGMGSSSSALKGEKLPVGDMIVCELFKRVTASGAVGRGGPVRSAGHSGISVKHRHFKDFLQQVHIY
jgi:hypothetical protein